MCGVALSSALAAFVFLVQNQACMPFLLNLRALVQQTNLNFQHGLEQAIPVPITCGEEVELPERSKCDTKGFREPNKTYASSGRPAEASLKTFQAECIFCASIGRIDLTRVLMAKVYFVRFQVN